MTWNNRIFRHTYQKGEEVHEHYQIHEAYYNEKGEMDGWTENVIAPCGDTVDELIEHLEQMLHDAKRSKDDVVDYKEEG